MPTAVPNYLQTNPNGDVGAVFPGGVSMYAATDFNDPPTQRSIRWVRESNGASVAEIAANENGGSPRLDMGAHSFGGHIFQGFSAALLTMALNGGGIPGIVRASVGANGAGPGADAIIINEKGDSEFPQVRGDVQVYGNPFGVIRPFHLRISAGLLAPPNGTDPLRWLWRIGHFTTCNYLGTGQYEINLTNWGPTHTSVWAQLETSNWGIARALTFSATNIQIHLADPGATVFRDNMVHVLVLQWVFDP